MRTVDVDFLAADFYEAISFTNGETPDFAPLKKLFFGDGILINNSFIKPIVFTAESFIQALESQIAEGNIQQFLQREVHSKTEIFGKVAQRVSIYEYNFADHEMERLPRGINYMQFVQIEGSWRITSMVWNDETESHIIPVEYLD